MSEYTIQKGKEPIRLFKSNFLEFFSHITPTVVLIVWVPILLFFLIRGVVLAVQYNTPFWHAPVLFFCGWFFWTFIEYFLHRFIFHYHPRTERLKKFFFTFHGVHHAQPMCKTRLVMPPVISIPIGLLLYGLFYGLFVAWLRQPVWFNFAFAGSTIGYIIYDIIHYTLHHAKSNSGYLAMCRRQHMRHHVKCPNMRYGVSIPIWDYIFGTMPPSGLGKKMTASDKG